MRCPVCGVAAMADDQTFCADCGAVLPANEPAVSAPPVVTVRTTPPESAAGHTTLVSPVAPMHVDPRGPLQWTPAVIAAVSTLAVVVLGLFLPFLRVEVAGDAVSDLSLAVNDISSNLLGALLLGLGLTVGGAVLASTGRAWGRGLCLGGSATLASLLALVAGGGALVLDEQVVAWRRTPGTYHVVTTYGAGYMVLLVGLLGAATTAVLAVPDLRREPTETDNSLLAAAGIAAAVGTAALVVGALLPGPGGSLGDNIAVDDWPPVALWMRLAGLVIILGLGLVGALTARRWSWGLLAALSVVACWQNSTALGQFGDQPFGIALGAVTPDPTDPFRPHVLTSSGVGLLVVAVLLGTLASFSRHQPTPG